MTSRTTTATLSVSPRTARGLGLALAAGTAVLLFLASGALGIVGDGGRADRAYVAVPAVLVLGSALARLRPAGMVLALGATALTLVVVSSSLLLTGVGGPDVSTSTSSVSPRSSRWGSSRRRGCSGGREFQRPAVRTPGGPTKLQPPTDSFVG